MLIARDNNFVRFLPRCQIVACTVQCAYIFFLLSQTIKTGSSENTDEPVLTLCWGVMLDKSTNAINSQPFRFGAANQTCI